MTIPSLALASGEIFLISSDLKLNRNYFLPIIVQLSSLFLNRTVLSLGYDRNFNKISAVQHLVHFFNFHDL